MTALVDVVVDADTTDVKRKIKMARKTMPSKIPERLASQEFEKEQTNLTVGS